MSRLQHIFLLIIAFIGLGCFPLPAQRGVFTESEFDKMAEEMAGDRVATIDPDDLKENYHLLDARPTKEYAVSHISEAVQVGYKSFDLETVEANYDVNDTIVVYCSVGYRSGKIAEQLQKAGYRNVYNLKGGLFGWANEQRPLVSGDQEATDKVHGYNKKWSKWLREEVPAVY